MTRGHRNTFTGGAFAALGATPTATDAADFHYKPRNTSSRPVASPPVLAPFATYSANSRYPEEDEYGAKSLHTFTHGDASVRSVDTVLPDDRDTTSKAATLASKAAARRKRLASIGTSEIASSRLPRREPGVTTLSEGRPPVTHGLRGDSLLGASGPQTTPRLSTEDRD